jgi:hypothetical protein
MGVDSSIILSTLKQVLAHSQLDTRCRLYALFQRQALGLVHEEVRVDKTSRTERAPNKEHFRSKIAFILGIHIRCNNCDDLLTS